MRLPFYLQESFKERAERITLYAAILSFVLHLLLILLEQFGWVDFGREEALLSNPISAIYTPFSFILIYEVYLLVFYLPRSITTYIAKQYEIITLIIIRRLFKDLGQIELSSNWFQISYDTQFTVDLLTSVCLFGLLFLFYRTAGTKAISSELPADASNGLKRFIRTKEIFSSILVPVIGILAVISLGQWIRETTYMGREAIADIKDVNNVFFDQFFTLLIIADVILLLVSFLNTDRFHKVIRNSGFIISTILIRLSFGVEGYLNDVLVVVAILYGLGVLWIHNLFEDRLKRE